MTYILFRGRIPTFIQLSADIVSLALTLNRV
jgi:hypothetical protein